MITRIYIDNFRTLVNFEWKPGKLALLLGENGSGKSSVIDALWGIRALVAEQGELRRWFPGVSRARWEKRFDLSIELDVQIEQQAYTYKLTIEHSPHEPNKSRVKHETLQLGDRLLMDFAMGELQLFDDDGARGPRVNGDWARSGLGAIAAGKDNKHLTAFKRWLRDDLWFLRPDPRAMSSRTDEEADELTPDLSNFASWLPRWIAQDFSGAMHATQALQQVLDGFQALQVSRTAPKLEATFLLEDSSPYVVDFSELSEGQRQLCSLYFLRHAVLQPGRLVIFDEPDNYVALREVQPWLSEVLELSLSASGPQVWFISHHPELLNQLAPSHGTRFFRGRGPTRVAPFAGAEGLTAAETVARGWDGE
ncbi:AAA family ATPase [Sorangium sp. So ce124]|uniref:AAA family ATPase n=1 Tax=Sorangium sp. So ce124 TaxID=3133280 RepID=UPI003F600195